MVGMGDLAFSLQMRDTIDRMVTARLDKERPKYRYATVVSINRATRKANVTYVGEQNPVQVNMGSIQPKSVGQTVRVGGIGTDKFIEDVMGESVSHDEIHVATSDAEVAALVAEFPPSRTQPLFVSRSDEPIDRRLRVTYDGVYWRTLANSPAPPVWIYPTLNSPFANYSISFGSTYHYAHVSYTKTSAGIVIIRGLVKGAASGTVFNLPVGYRPDHKILFGAIKNPDVGSRIDVNAGGDVNVVAGDTGWTSIQAMFPAADPARVWTPVTYISPWLHYDTSGDTSWGGLRYWKDSLGRVWFQGLTRSPTNPGSVNHPIFTLPVGYRPGMELHFPGIGNGDFQSMGILANGQVVWKGNAQQLYNYVGINNMAFPVEGSHKWDTLGTMGSGITPYNATYPGPQHTISDDGIVWLRGLVGGGTYPGVMIEQLPPGRRLGREGWNTELVHFSANNVIGRAELQGIFWNRVSSQKGSATWSSLDGIKFLAGDF